MHPTLVVLAAGMGSRYGGLKQIDPVGPGGEVILDYSVHDAMAAGFGKVVFVLRRDMEEVFRETVGARFEERVSVGYAFQELEDLPAGFKVPEGRTKPWGTTHAVLACRHLVNEPFGVINADDFYGATSFRILAEALRSRAGTSGNYALVGFPLRNTLSGHGTVSRGICDVGEDGFLRHIEECHDIRAVGDAVELRRGGTLERVGGDRQVSMNMWGFCPDFLLHAAARFGDFLRGMENPLRSEYYLPSIVRDLMDAGAAQVQVLSSGESWLGVTYPEDKPLVREGLRRLVDAGIYPEPLWG